MNQNPYQTDTSGDNARTNAGGSEANVRLLMVIAVALLCGLLFFTGIVLVLTAGQLQWKLGVVTMVAAGMAVMNTMLHVAIPGLVAGTELKKLSGANRGSSASVPDAALLRIFQTQMLIALALLEGAGFFCSIAVLTDKSWIPLLLVGGLVTLMLLRFPSSGRVQFWLEDKRRELNLNAD